MLSMLSKAFNWLPALKEGAEKLFSSAKENEPSAPIQRREESIPFWKGRNFQRAGEIVTRAYQNKPLMSSIGSLFRDYGENLRPDETFMQKAARGVGEFLGAGPSDEYKQQMADKRNVKLYGDYMGAYRQNIMPLRQQQYDTMYKNLGLSHLMYGRDAGNLPFRQMYESPQEKQPSIEAQPQAGGYNIQLQPL